MAAFFVAIWIALGGLGVLLLFFALVALFAVPVTLSAAITRAVCGPGSESRDLSA